MYCFWKKIYILVFIWPDWIYLYKMLDPIKRTYLFTSLRILGKLTENWQFSPTPALFKTSIRHPRSNTEHAAGYEDMESREEIQAESPTRHSKSCGWTQSYRAWARETQGQSPRNSTSKVWEIRHRGRDVKNETQVGCKNKRAGVSNMWMGRKGGERERETKRNQPEIQEI